MEPDAVTVTAKAGQSEWVQSVFKNIPWEPGMEVDAVIQQVEAG